MNESKILDVTALNFYIKNRIEGDPFLSRVYVRGEISNLVRHAAGHYYFSLKDENGKIAGMMFSTYVGKMKYPVENGDQVLLYGRVGLYEKSGTYQIYAYSMVPYGVGKHLLELEALKRKLREEGLFDRAKKAINPYPKKIALITSTSGAAVQDLKHTLTSRWPCAIVVYPSLVQGDGAKKSILDSLERANRSDCDTIILSRGGGAKEDLNVFNEEAIVRKCAALRKPLISAIGHQIDRSLVDEVADLYCITPTEAGEKACADRREVIQNLNHLEAVAFQAIVGRIRKEQNRLLNAIAAFCRFDPVHRLETDLYRVERIRECADAAIQNRIGRLRENLRLLKEKIIWLNPDRVPENGTALVYRKRERIRAAGEVKEGETIELVFRDGKIVAKVERIEKNGEKL